MIHLIYLLTTLLAGMQPSSPNAEIIARMPHRLIFASQYGTHGVTIHITYSDLAMDTVTAKLFTYDETGKVKVLWEKRLTHLPKRVLVSDSGAVVALGQFARSTTREHAIVVYDKTGEIVADHHIADIMPAEDVRRHAKLWIPRMSVLFAREKLEMQLHWGLKIEVDLGTGRVSPGSKGAGPGSS